MDEKILKYIDLIRESAKKNYKKCFREAGGKFRYPYFVPGASYAHELWDWDSWLTDIALAEIAGEENISKYEKGCVLNFLEHADEEGRIPINIKMDRESIFDLKPGSEVNIHKPCLAQHALFVSEKNGNDAEWLRKNFSVLKRFIRWYEENCYHEESGLFFWINDFAIGVDNDPCVFYRPNKSTGSIFLNNLMYGELCAMEKLCLLLRDEKAREYRNKAEALKEAIQRECWDERDGFFYSADLNLKPVVPGEWLHSGAPRHWKSLPMRIGVWTGFLAMRSGIATEEQAKRMAEEHYLNDGTFRAPYGIRSLSKSERMYAIKNSGNPSCWIGPVWGNCNYMVFEGLLRYGYEDLAEELAVKTVKLFGQDLERCGEWHEYYDPETGDGIRNQGFQSWNLLSYNMAEWLRNKIISED